MYKTIVYPNTFIFLYGSKERNICNIVIYIFSPEMLALHLNMCVFELEFTVLLVRGEKYLLYFVEKRLQKFVPIDMNEIVIQFQKIFLFKKFFFPNSVFQDSCKHFV